MLPHWGFPPEKSWFAPALVPDVLTGRVDDVAGWIMSIQWDTTVINAVFADVAGSRGGH